MGMNPEPMKSHSIASRCICVKCGRTPPHVEARGSDLIQITVECHGETASKTVLKRELVFTQRFFQDPESDDGGDYSA